MQPQYQQPGPSAPGATMAMQYPVIVVQGTPHSVGCVAKTFKVTGILHIVGACLCILFGIAAICLHAGASFIAVPLWGSMLIFIPTGIIGTVYYCQPKNKCIGKTYLVLTIMSALLAGSMSVMSIAVTFDESNNSCRPLIYTDCDIPLEARLAVDLLLLVIYFLELACGVTAASASCFKLFRCCRKCCQGVIYYGASGGDAPRMPMQANPPARPIDVAGGGSSVPAAQSAGMMYLSPGSQPSQGFVAVQPTSPPPSAVPQTQQGFVAVQPAGPSPSAGPQPQGNVAVQPAGPPPSVVPQPQQGCVAVQRTAQPPPAMQQSGPSPNVQAGPVPVTGTYTNIQAQGFYTQQPQAQVEEHVMPQEPQAPQKDEPQQEEEAAGQVTSGQFNDQAALI